MRKYLFISLTLFVAAIQLCHAQRNIKGGWVSYRHIVDLPLFNETLYEVSVHYYGATSYLGARLRVYDASNGEPIENIDLSPPAPDTVTLTNHFSDCINSSGLNNRYKVNILTYVIRFPISPKSYLVASFLRGHDPGFVNIYGPGGTGILYTANILGVVNGIDYHTNSSPVFEFTDTVSVCRNTAFTLPLIVTDRDGDSLSYRFGEAIDAPFDTTSPPLFPIVYNAPFSGAQPMGSGVTIDPVTGVISGTAPDMPGGYLVTVYVDEWRNGILINTTRKESQIKVVSCPFVKPLLKPLFSSCKKYTYNFKTEPTCPVVTSWFWDFGVVGSSTDTSSLATPTFTYPAVPGNYTLKLKVANNFGYVDSATAVVKIVDTITVQIKADTGICKTDSIVLKPVSDGINYLWRESGGGSTLNSYAIRNPVARPVADSTTYFVTAQLDACIDSGKIKVYASPYPKAKASADAVICFSGGVTISGTISGSIFSWSPVSSLQQSNTLQPFARPTQTTAYILSVRDTFYCPKTVRDTVIVKVIRPFKIDAGKDKSVSLGYPFQLSATGDNNVLRYSWQPAVYLTNSTIYNPVATISNTSLNKIPFTVTATTRDGCSVSDEVLITVYNIGPDILVPTAFTPNADGRNDILKPILIGIHQFDYFRIYNRYGQIIYSTTDSDAGWDGRVKGQQESPDTYVFVAQGKAYGGKTILKKGTVVLIR